MGEDDFDKVSLKQHWRDHPAIICFAVRLSFVWVPFDLCLKHDEERDGDILRVKSTARNDLNVTGASNLFCGDDKFTRFWIYSSRWNQAN